MQPLHRHSVDPNTFDSSLTDTGALCASSGLRTGRSPNDKRVVLDDVTKDSIWWGKVNIPISPQGYARNRARTVDYLNLRPEIFVIDGYAGWDEKYRLNIRVICARPYHALFMKQMLIRGENAQFEKDFGKKIDFTVLNAGEFPADPTTEDVKNQTSVNVNFTTHELTVLGS